MSRLSALNYKAVQLISYLIIYLLFWAGWGRHGNLAAVNSEYKKALFSPHFSNIPHPQQVPVMELRSICGSSLTSGFTNGCGYYLAVSERQES